jgi:hypothetical protein
LELVLWKIRINENIQELKIVQDKKELVCGLSIRRQCQITCGADVVIEHALPYLISTEDEESD